MNETTPSARDEAYQQRILQGVSRTFALTIPQLPAPLARVVGNAYLLCRIADTIEDDKEMPFAQKREYADMFIRVVAGEVDAARFARALSPLLAAGSREAERDLVANTPAVIRVAHSFNPRQRRALERCVRVMADGMARYQESNVTDGLADQEDMDGYCYHVAGVVGEMLTELFCDYSAEINRHYDEMLVLAVSFGQGLQMTNILKDIWDDQERNMCWLPRSVFEKHGSSIADLRRRKRDQKFQNAIGHLVGVARGHLANALRYTLLIPRREAGLRRFCLYALGMAVLTLRKINRKRDFTSGDEVKITRRSVKLTILASNILLRSDSLLRLAFWLGARSL